MSRMDPQDALREAMMRSPVRVAGGRSQTAASIAAEWADKCGHSLADMLGPSKKWPLAHHRQMCWADIRDRTELSLQQIGKAFNRHHTSIMFGVKAVGRREQSTSERLRDAKAEAGE